jgi:PBSX family phage terminase large subunit
MKTKINTNYDDRNACLAETIRQHAAAKTKETVFVYKPFSLKQKQVLTWWLPTSPHCHKDGIIADGAIRSGKTVCLSLAYGIWAMTMFVGQNFLICGKTIGSLRRNVVVDWKRQMAAQGYTVSDRLTDNILTVRKGDIVNYFHLFGGSDEGSQDLVQGITAAGALFDEAALMPESFVNQATGRCSVTGSKFWFNCNPGSPAHWFKTKWINRIRGVDKTAEFDEDNPEKKLLYLHFTMEDNLSLSEEIKARYRSMYSGVFFQRYIQGLWAQAEGIIYPMFNADKHTFDDDEMPTSGNYYISTDYGTVNPFSAGLWCLTDDKAYRLKEYYHDSRKTGKHLTDEEYADAVEALIGNLPIEYHIVDPSATSYIACMRRRGHSILGASNSVVPGIMNVASALTCDRLRIHVSCKDSIREYGVYAWDVDADKDKPMKVFDHAMDDTRYFVHSVLRNEWEGIFRY